MSLITTEQLHFYKCIVPAGTRCRPATDEEASRIRERKQGQKTPFLQQMCPPFEEDGDEIVVFEDGPLAGRTVIVMGNQVRDAG